jgi:hypothetical protein
MKKSWTLCGEDVSFFIGLSVNILRPYLSIDMLKVALGFEKLPGVYLLYTIFNPRYILVSYQPKISLEPVPRPI